EVALSALGVFLLRHKAQSTRITEIFIDAEIHIQAERLRKVSHLRACLAGRCSKNADLSAPMLQHARHDLECRCLARPIRANEPKNLPRAPLEVASIGAL